MIDWWCSLDVCCLTVINQKRCNLLRNNHFFVGFAVSRPFSSSNKVFGKAALSPLLARWSKQPYCQVSWEVQQLRPSSTRLFHPPPPTPHPPTEEGEVGWSKTTQVTAAVTRARCTEGTRKYMVRHFIPHTHSHTRKAKVFEEFQYCFD